LPEWKQGGAGDLQFLARDSGTCFVNKTGLLQLINIITIVVLFAKA
jgi:hypothetical protein